MKPAVTPAGYLCIFIFCFDSVLWYDETTGQRDLDLACLCLRLRWLWELMTNRSCVSSGCYLCFRGRAKVKEKDCPQLLLPNTHTHTHTHMHTAEIVCKIAVSCTTGLTQSSKMSCKWLNNYSSYSSSTPSLSLVAEAKQDLAQGVW